MSKNEIGIGSASVVLVFTVLCFTIFALISYTAAGNYKALTEAEAKLVKSYYKADAIAERILAEILASDEIPAAIHGIEIKTRRDYDLMAEIVEFSNIISDEKELYVNVAIYMDSYDILSWRIRSTKEWRADDSLPVLIYN
jgi:hypothetical protein